MRIVSLLPAATEILYALGLATEVVGVSAGCDHPSDALAVPRATTAAGLDRAALVGLEPDLVLVGDGSTGSGAREVREALAVLGADVSVVTLAPTSVEGVFNAISTVGAMTEAEDAAMDVVERLRERLRAVEQIVIGRRDHGFRPPRVAALDGLVPPRAVGWWVPDQVRLAGGWELLGAAGGAPSPSSWDAIREVDPEVLVLMPRELDLEAGLAAWARVSPPAGWADLRAVSERCVFLVDGACHSRPGPRIVDGIETLAELIDPLAFDGMAPPASWARVG